MSNKMSDLAYEMQRLVTEIDCIEDEELKESIMSAYEEVEKVINDIDSYLTDIETTINKLV